MKLPGPLFYKLPELATRWRKTENELLHVAAAGTLRLSIWYPKGGGVYNCVDKDNHIGMYEGPASLEKKDIWRLLAAPYVSVKYFYEENGDRFKVYSYGNSEARIDVYAGELIGMADEVTRMETEYPELLPPSGDQEERHPGGTKPDTNKKTNGGRPKTPFKESMEYAFNKFHNEGNRAILERGNVLAFVDQIKKVMQEEKKNGNIEQYLSDRIKEIKPKGGRLIITTAEYTPERGANKGRAMPPRDYQLGDVSKALTSLRKDKNI